MKPFANTNKQYMQRFFTVFLCMFIFAASYSQSLNQGISGQVIDKESKQALCGVELIIKNSDPIIAAVTNETGYFRFEDIPQGRFYVQVSYPDYKYKVINKVDVYPGKPEVLCIELTNKKPSKKNRGNLKTRIKGLITGLP